MVGVGGCRVLEHASVPLRGSIASWLLAQREATLTLKLSSVVVLLSVEELWSTLCKCLFPLLDFTGSWSGSSVLKWEVVLVLLPAHVVQ